MKVVFFCQERARVVDELVSRVRGLFRRSQPDLNATNLCISCEGLSAQVSSPLTPTESRPLSCLLENQDRVRLVLSLSLLRGWGV